MGESDFGFDAPEFAGNVARPVVRLSALEEAVQLYKQRWGVWILASLVVLVCYLPIVNVLVRAFGFPRVVGIGGFRMPLSPPGRTRAQVAVTMIVLGFFLGGMFRMACKQVRGLPMGVEDMFRIFDILPNLFLGAMIWGLVSFAASCCFFIPGLIVSALLMFTVPLIVDGGLSATEAIGASWNALKSQWLAATVFHSVASTVAWLGLCCCGVGIVFSAPLYVLSITILYRDFFLLAGTVGGAKPKPSFPEI